MSVLTITSENFEAEVLNASKLVLIDFWAPWCGPCRMLSPVVDEIAEETDVAIIGKVNVDDEGELAQRFGVMSIPTLILFRGGKPVAQTVGVQPKQAILDMLAK